jgi:hypothetical protein
MNFTAEFPTLMIFIYLLQGPKIGPFFYTTGKAMNERDSTPRILTLPRFLCQTFRMDSLLG